MHDPSSSVRLAAYSEFNRRMYPDSGHCLNLAMNEQDPETRDKVGAIYIKKVTDLGMIISLMKLSVGKNIQDEIIARLRDLARCYTPKEEKYYEDESHTVTETDWVPEGPDNYPIKEVEVEHKTTTQVERVRMVDVFDRMPTREKRPAIEEHYNLPYKSLEER